MPSRPSLIEQVANQMMKGGKNYKLNFVVGTKQRVNFQRRHQKHIEWAIDNLPRCSAAVHAVVVKCLIKYDHNMVAAFCKALRDGFFNGTNDPAHLLWKFLQKHQRDSTIAYRYTVGAAKAYMQGKTLITLRPLKEDIFNWDEDWTVPDELLANWRPDLVPGEEPQTRSNERVVESV